MAAGERVIERRWTQGVVGAASPPRCRGRKVLPVAAETPLPRISWLSWLALLFSLTAPLYAQTRVALVSACGGEAGQNVLALADAALSAETNMALVERREVERVLQEQKLAHCGLSEAQQAVTVGRLLGVQVFASLETVPGEKEALGLVVFDASKGVRLWDAALTAGSAEKTAEAVAAAVRAACEKRQSKAASLHTVCLLSVRNVDLPRGLDGVCEAVGRLMERRLVDSKSLTVLERERLEQVNRERALPTNGTTEELFPSLTLLEVEVARGRGGSGLEATVLLTDAAGADLGKIVASTGQQDAVELAEALVARITKTLKATPPGQRPNPEREAARFREEATFWSEHSRIELALPAAEAAYALDPGQKAYRDKLATYLIGCAGGLVTSNTQRSVALAERAMNLCEAILGDGSDPKTEGVLFNYLYRSWFPSDIDPECLQRIRSLKERHWRICEAIEQRAFASSTAGHLSQPYSPVIGEIVPWMYGRIIASGSDATVTRARFMQLVTRWMELVDRRGLSKTWSLSRTMKVLTGRESTIDSWMPRNAALTRQMDEVFQVMRDDTNSVIQLYGLYGKIWVEMQNTNQAPEHVRSQVKEFQESASRLIENSPSKEGETTRYLCYLATLDAMDLVSGPDDRSELFQELFDFMLSQKDLVPYVCWAATSTSIGDRRHYYSQAGHLRPISRKEYPRLIKNCENILAAFDSSEFHRLDGGGEFQQVFDRVKIEEIRDNLRRDVGDTNTVAQAPWQSTSLLFDVRENSPGYKIADLILGKESAWLVTIQEEGIVNSTHKLKLLRLSLSGGTPQSLRQVDIRGDIAPGSCLSESMIPISTEGSGVLLFSTDGRSPVIVDTKNGLPSDHVQSAAVMGGKLYAGLGQAGHDAYLAAYDLQTSRCEILASSQRRQKLTPFDNVTPPYNIRAIIPDPARGRLVLVADFGDDMNNHNDYNPLIGIWEFDCDHKTFKQLVRFYRTSRWIGPLCEGELLLALWSSNPWQPETRYRPWYGTVSFNLRDDLAKVLYARHKTEAGPQTPITTKTIVSDYLAEPPHLFLNGWLWSGKNWKRVSADGKRCETLSPLAAGKSGPATSFRWLERLPNTDQAIVANEHAIWLLTLPETTSKVSR